MSRNFHQPLRSHCITKLTVTELLLCRSLEIWHNTPLTNTMFTIDSRDIPLLAGSIDVILNEQIFSSDGIFSSGIEVNAIHLIFSNVGVGLGPLMDMGLLNGNVYIASSEALQDTAAVPYQIRKLKCTDFLTNSPME